MNQKLSFQYTEEFNVVIVLMPVIFALHLLKSLPGRDRFGVEPNSDRCATSLFEFPFVSAKLG